MRDSLNVDIVLVVLGFMVLLSNGLSIVNAVMDIDHSMLLPTCGAGFITVYLFQMRLKHGHLIFINDIRLMLTLGLLVLCNAVISSFGFVSLQHAGYF